MSIHDFGDFGDLQEPKSHWSVQLEPRSQSHYTERVTSKINTHSQKIHTTSGMQDVISKKDWNIRTQSKLQELLTSELSNWT